MIKKIVLTLAVAAPFLSASAIPMPSCNPCKVAPTSQKIQPVAKTVVHVAASHNR